MKKDELLSKRRDRIGHGTVASCDREMMEVRIMRTTAELERVLHKLVLSVGTVGGAIPAIAIASLAFPPLGPGVAFAAAGIGMVSGGCVAECAYRWVLGG
jgi:hypothetical protein